MVANGKMQYNPGWESGSMKTLAAHGLAGGIVQDRMGGSFGAGFVMLGFKFTTITKCPTMIHTLIKQIPKRPPAPRLRIYHRQSPRWMGLIHLLDR
jgi:hypothetical protein